MDTRKEQISKAKTQLILDSIKGNGSQEPKAKLQHLKDNWYSQWHNDDTQLCDYLISKESCCTIPVAYCDILSAAVSIGILSENATPEKEDVILANWLPCISKHVMVLFSGYGITN